MHFEFADSEIAQCIWSEGRLLLRFAAARLLEGQGHAARAVWAPVVLTAEKVEPWESFDAITCAGPVRRGVVLHDSQRLQSLPMPCTLQGVVTLELEFAQGGVVHLRCQGLAVELAPGTVAQAYQC